MILTRHLKQASYLNQPWKNGKGNTLEIAIDAQKPYLWRLSLASLVESAPFSLFPGYNRTLVLLNGGPITLSHKGKPEKLLRPMESYAFSGEWETSSTVQSPGDDFNAFALQGKAKASIYPTRLAKDEELLFPLARQEHFIYCSEGEMAIYDLNSDKRFVLKCGETLQLSRHSDKEFLNIRAKGIAEQTQCLWIVVRLQEG